MTIMNKPNRDFVPGDDPGDQQPPRPVQALGERLSKRERVAQPERRTLRSLLGPCS